jgi:hypothetical protein
MASHKRSDPDQSRHWHECAENSDDESEDGTAIKKDSDDKSDAGYVENESISDEEPLRRRAKREQRVERPEVKIFTEDLDGNGPQKSLLVTIY